MTNADFLLPIKLKEIIDGPEPYCLVHGGRLGGKTKGAVVISTATLMEYPDTDVVAARASYGSLGDSSYSEFEEAIGGLDEMLKERFTFRKSPLRIQYCNQGTIYFMGYGGSTDRTRSFKPKHKISVVILEETQELRKRENLDQALASFRRHFGEKVKVIIMGNNPAQKAHWFNQYIEECKQDKDYKVIHMSYLDILPFINDYDLKEVLKVKRRNPDKYEWMYMGQPTGAFGSVYPMFDQQDHVITSREFSFFLENSTTKIVGCVIGGDGAVNRDATSFVPIFLLSNGESAVGPIFYHNPQESGQMGYHKLVQDHVRRWLEELIRAYNLGSKEDVERNPYAQIKPIWMRIDSAAPDLVQECRYFFGDRVDVGPYKKSSIQEMVGVCQSAISSDRVYVVDYGGHKNYVENKWSTDQMNLLCQQLDQLIWNEKQTGYDPIVPNDVCDAWTYGTGFWFGNTENINWFDIVRNNRVANESIRDRITKERKRT